MDGWCYYLRYDLETVCLWCKTVHNRCGQHTVTFSKSASEQEGERGLTGLREGELPTLETYSGSGTYRTCKHKPSLFLHRRNLCAGVHTCMHEGTRGRALSHTHVHAWVGIEHGIIWLHFMLLTGKNKIGVTVLELHTKRLLTAKSLCKQIYQPGLFTGICLSKRYYRNVTAEIIALMPQHFQSK